MSSAKKRQDRARFIGAMAAGNVGTAVDIVTSRIEKMPPQMFTCEECGNVHRLPYAGGDDDHPTCGFCVGSEMLGLRRS